MYFAKQLVAVIFNPTGGSAKSGTIDKLVAALEKRSIKVVKLTTTPAPKSASELALSAVRDYGVDLVIACGGDGTVCQSAEGLMQSEADASRRTPMAVFPAGTGNLFARAFYSVPDPEQFVNMIMAGQPQPVDMVELTAEDAQGQSHKQLYIVASGFGKLSDAISYASPRMKRMFGTFAYFVGVLKASLSPNPVTYQISCGDCGETPKSVKASAVFALNAVPPSMVALSRGCNASDGLIDLVAFRSANFFALSRLSFKMLSGRPDLHADYYRARSPRIRIETDRPVTPNIDGDPGVPTRKMELVSVPGACRIIVS